MTAPVAYPAPNAKRARIRITMPVPSAGVFYVEPGDAPSEGRDLLHGEEHEVDVTFARRLIAQKRAVLADGHTLAPVGPLTSESASGRRK
jgi:hypothetical protein